MQPVRQNQIALADVEADSLGAEGSAMSSPALIVCDGTHYIVVFVQAHHKTLFFCDPRQSRTFMPDHDHHLFSAVSRVT